jgi:hypothetical protein
MAERLECGGELTAAHVEQLLAAERTLYGRLLGAFERAVA